MSRHGYTWIKNTDRGGFTLIEVLASILLIALALIPIMTIIPQIIRNSVRNERFTTVIFLADKKIEEVKRDAIYAYATFSGDESATLFASPYEDYKYKVTDTGAGSPIRDIQVQVWYDEDGDSNPDQDSITLDTKIADRG